MEAICSSLSSQLCNFGHSAEILGVSCCLPIVGKINIIATYKRHACSVIEFTRILSDLLPLAGSKTILDGYLNVDLFNPRSDSAISDLCLVLNSFNFIPTIDKPTRVTDTSSTLIDHIWVNFANSYSSFVFSSFMSDHFPVGIIFDKLKASDVVTLSFRDYSVDNISSFQNSFPASCQAFQFHPADPEIYIDEVKQLTLCEINKYFPVRVKTIKLHKLSKPWINADLRSKIKMKHILIKHFKRGVISWKTVKEFTKNLQYQIGIARNDYFKKAFIAAKTNIKKTWRLINQCLEKKRESKISKLVIDDRVVSSPQEIANQLNSYFVSVAESIHSSIPRVDNVFLNNIPHISNSIFLSPSTPFEVLPLIKNLKNIATTNEEIPARVLKWSPDCFSKLISDGFNLMLQSGSFPDCLKIARVVPLSKDSRNNTQPSNYRPISLLPIISKIYEKLLASRFVSFLESNNVINPRQYGFLKGKDTTLACLDLINAILPAFTVKSICICLFFDFSKAFDCVDHGILLRKLYIYGFRGGVFNLMRSYLSNRKQYVCVGGTVSETKNLSCGVPQGSTLGPLLFNLYANDIYYLNLHKKMSQYADDTSYLIMGNDLHDMVGRVNNDLTLFYDWCRANKLLLNLNKTKAIMFSSKKITEPPTLIVNNISIGFVSSLKYLGLTLDNKLNYFGHIDLVLSRLAKIAGVSFYLGKKMSFEAARAFYFATAHLILNYMIVLWGGSYISYLDRVFVVQKRILRNLFSHHLPSDVSTIEIFSNVGIVKVYDLHKIELGKLVYLILNSNRYPVFVEELNRLGWSHSYNTRKINEYRLPHSRVLVDQHGVLFRSVKLWNSLPLEIRTSPSLAVLKKRLMLYLINCPSLG